MKINGVHLPLSHHCHGSHTVGRLKWIPRAPWIVWPVRVSLRLMSPETWSLSLVVPVGGPPDNTGHTKDHTSGHTLSLVVPVGGPPDNTEHIKDQTPGHTLSLVVPVWGPPDNTGHIKDNTSGHRHMWITHQGIVLLLEWLSEGIIFMPHKSHFKLETIIA